MTGGERSRRSMLERLQDRFYPSAETRDPVPGFLAEVRRHVRPDDVVLDLGAGAGERNPHDLRGSCREVIGVDADPRVVDNPLLDRGIVGDLRELPLPDASIDLALAVYVLEHIENVEAFLAELGRVLAPGGRFFALMPNRLHYVALIASTTPLSFHRWINERRGRARADTFPTYYRLNTAGAVRRRFAAAGFEPLFVRTMEVQPNYLTFWWPLFLCGVLYERVVSSSRLLAPFRASILCGFRKSPPT